MVEVAPEPGYRAPLVAAFNWRRLVMWAAIILPLVNAPLLAKFLLVLFFYLLVPFARWAFRVSRVNEDEMFDTSEHNRNWLGAFHVNSIGWFIFVAVPIYYIVYRLIPTSLRFPTFGLHDYFYASARFLQQTMGRSNTSFAVQSANAIALLFLAAVTLVAVNDMMMPIELREFRTPLGDATKVRKMRRSFYLIGGWLLFMSLSSSFLFNVNNRTTWQDNLLDLQKFTPGILAWAMFAFMVYMSALALRAMLARLFGPEANAAAAQGLDPTAPLASRAP